VGSLRFHATGSVGSSFEPGPAADDVTSIEVTTIDALAEELGPPTLVKCEAEGADRQVVEGAARTIARHKPRLAVTVYHLPDDFLVLLPQLRAANPDYRLALRHYTVDHSGTTVYAY
jgi:hypothetical protein